MEGRYVELYRKGVWVRVAGHSQRIRARDEFRWRYQLEGNRTHFLIANWQVVGQSSVENFRTGTNPAAKGEEELLAWIDLYGDLSVNAKGQATITLQNPLHGPQF